MSQLTVKRYIDGQSVTYSYDLRSSVGESTGVEQEYIVTANPGLVGDLCQEIHDVVHRAQEGEDIGSELARNGKLLYDTLFPAVHVNIADLARRLHSEDPLLVCSNEPEIPWELLYDGTDFLCLRHDLGRKTFVGQQVVSGRAVGALRRALIASDSLGDLGAAREEARNIASWLGNRGTECTSLLGPAASMIGLVQALSEGEFDLFHYSGHVDTPSGSTLTGLRLHEDQILDEHVLQVLWNKGVPPIVFINGCASAGHLSNLCVAFMINGAKVVIGTRYPVPDEAARQFAESFYDAMLEGQSAGAAVRMARGSVAEAGGIDWASFVLYGDPSVAIAFPRPEDADHAVVSGATAETTLDPQASALMRRVERRAASHGIATSLDLLTELVPTHEFCGRVAGAAGSANLAVLQILLSSVQDGTPPVTDQAVELSGTVQSVLDRAKRHAQESGRGLVTIDDVVDAFFAVGGGHSREILELTGIPLPGGEAAPPGRRSRAGGFRAADPRAGTEASVNGHDADGARRPPFGSDGYLDRAAITPGVASALLVAGLWAASQGSVVSTSMLAATFAATNSDALREAFADQGAIGEAAFGELASSVRLSQRLFSPRTLRALRRAADGTIKGRTDDAAILRELLGDEDSTARQMLRKLNLDPAEVLRSLTPPQQGGGGEGSCSK